MKTSVTQFELLINFMEENGDINKPVKDARGRIKNIEKWQSLTDILNSDATGHSKTTEKWKKVWSDLKNNTKKKAAKITRAACGTGGGPALQSKLTELEERVLQIIGPQAATGMAAVAEAGFVQRDIQNDTDTNRTATLPTSPPATEASQSILEMVLDGENTPIIFGDLWGQCGAEQEHPVAESTHTRSITWQEEYAEASAAPAPSAPAAPVAAPTPPPAPAAPRPSAPPTPTRRGHTPRRPRGRPASTARPNRPRPRFSHVEQAAQHFVQADEEWRNFLRKQHEDLMLVKEREIQCQQRWQEITDKVISVLNKAVDKL